MFEWIERLKPSLSVVSGASLDAEDELSTMQIAKNYPRKGNKTKYESSEVGLAALGFGQFQLQRTD